MKEITDAIKERLNNSFSGPYTIFFLLINWKIAAYLLTGSDDAQSRINNVTEYLGKSGKNYFLCPLYSTLIYILIIPLIASAIDFYKSFVEIQKQKEIEKMRVKFDKTWERRFEIVKVLSNKLINNINTIVNNGITSFSSLKNQQKYLDALIESENKNILEHFSELRKSGDI